MSDVVLDTKLDQNSWGDATFMESWSPRAVFTDSGFLGLDSGQFLETPVIASDCLRVVVLSQ